MRKKRLHCPVCTNLYPPTWQCDVCGTSMCSECGFRHRAEDARCSPVFKARDEAAKAKK